MNDAGLDLHALTSPDGTFDTDTLRIALAESPCHTAYGTIVEVGFSQRRIVARLCDCESQIRWCVTRSAREGRGEDDRYTTDTETRFLLLLGAVGVRSWARWQFLPEATAILQPVPKGDLP